MTSLYTSSSGREVTHSSSSSLDVFRLCRRKFKLSRIDGWRQKEKKASREFGKCIESAVQYYHDNGLKSGEAITEFQRLWAKFIDQTDLTYTDQETDWKSLNTQGQEMMRLYEITLPTLPIKNPKWQLQFLKPLWPGDPTYGDLQFMGYVDLLSTLEDGTRIVVDIKTAKSMLDVTPGMMSLDGQLRKYAWVSGIRDVAFLNFVKTKPDDFKKGTSVTLLEDVEVGGVSDALKAGQQFVVAKFQAPKEAVEAAEGVKASPAVPWTMFVATEETVQKMDKELDAISGKGAKEATAAVFTNYIISGGLVQVKRDQITKTRLQFVRGTIPEAELTEIGEQIGSDTMAVHQSSKTGLYPKDGGVRFPNAVCGWCEMRGICLKDNKLRDELLVQIGPKVQDDDWLKELESEVE